MKQTRGEPNMRVTELYGKKKPVVSLEFFPPRNEKATEEFEKTVDRLAESKPDYMTMTFGAGGSTRDGSYQGVKLLVEKKQPTVAYIAGYGLAPQEIADVLNRYKDLGIETIYVIRGDIPKEATFIKHPQSFSYASEMIAHIKKNFDFTLGCAGYPEGHIEAQSLEKDIEHLKQKVDNGAEYVVTQYFYNNDFYYSYVDKCRASGIHVPIIPGIMPVYTVKLIMSLCKICGSTLTTDLQKKLDAVNQDDKDAVLNIGIEYATEQCRDLLDQGVDGLHFYTMDRSHSTTEILGRLRGEGLL